MGVPVAYVPVLSSHLGADIRTQARKGASTMPTGVHGRGNERGPPTVPLSPKAT